MKNIFLVFFLFIINLAFCQNEKYTNSEKVVIEVFGKCYEDLDFIEGTISILPEKKNVKFCSLYQCVSRIERAEKNKDIEEKIIKRALEIASRLYDEGTPIYLTYGANSSSKAYSENEILTDDNNLVYESVAECVVSSSLVKISDAVNKKTMQLIKNKLK